jgi:hypothetical protein
MAVRSRADQALSCHVKPIDGCTVERLLFAVYGHYYGTFRTRPKLFGRVVPGSKPDMRIRSSDLRAQPTSDIDGESLDEHLPNVINSETSARIGFPAIHGLVRGVRPEFQDVANKHRVRREIQ